MTNADPMKCECLRWAREFKPGDLSEDGREVFSHHPNCLQQVVRECDNLRAQVALLTKQRDTARKERDGMVQRRYRWKEAVEERNAAVKERDELRERVARLEQEGAELARCLHWSNGEILKLRNNVSSLRAALEEYGRHLSYCQSVEDDAMGCTCDLAEALSKASEENRQ